MFLKMEGDELLTLGQLRRAGRFVRAVCRTCRRENQLHPDTLIHKLGPHIRVGWCAASLRCSRCGSKNVVAKPGARPRHPGKYPKPDRG